MPTVCRRKGYSGGVLGLEGRFLEKFEISTNYISGRHRKYTSIYVYNIYVPFFLFFFFLYLVTTNTFLYY